MTHLFYFHFFLYKACNNYSLWALLRVIFCEIWFCFNSTEFSLPNPFDFSRRYLSNTQLLQALYNSSQAEKKQRELTKYDQEN